MGLTHPLLVWTVSDGRAGIDNQVLGVAESLAERTPCEIVQKRIAWKAFLDPLPPRANPAPDWGHTSRSSDFNPPWPDLWIAAGRASLPLSVRMRRRSSGRTFVVQLQDPRLPARLFDLVAPPKHDRLSGVGIFPLTGSPHRVTPQRLDQARLAFAAQIDPLPSPRVALLVGGKSKAFDLSPKRAEALAADVARALEDNGAALLMTFSRRTPASARKILEERLGSYPGLIWNGDGDNPYFAFLAAADFIIVTRDSVNMVAEARPQRARPSTSRRSTGISGANVCFTPTSRLWASPGLLSGCLSGSPMSPLCETGRLADEILRRLIERRLNR